MTNGAAFELVEAIEASVAALALMVPGMDVVAVGNASTGNLGSGSAGHFGPDSAGNLGSAGGDPLRRTADGWLDTLAGAARLNAQVAALTARAAAGYAAAAQAMASPDASTRAEEMAVVAEVACALTVGEQAAGALLAESHPLTTALPLTLAALEAGSMSWQHARIMATKPPALTVPGRRRWRRTSWTPMHRTRRGAARPGNWWRPGSGRRPGPGGNATTGSAWKTPHLGPG
jgi:hypothetical protein